MQSQAVLVYAPAGGCPPAILAALKAGGSYVAATSELEPALNAARGGLCEAVVALSPSHADLASLASSGPAVPIIAAFADASHDTLLYARDASHVSRIYGEGLSSDELARRIAIVLRSIVNDDFGGVDKWMSGFGIDFCNYELHSSRHRDELVKCIADYLEWLGARSTIQANVLDAVDELSTNAIYNAPIDAEGHRYYAGLERRTDVSLAPHEYARARFGSDGRRFAISIVDFFGSMTWSRLGNRIHECLRSASIERKAGGAGLGLYIMLRNAEQVIVNSCPGVSTEVIAVFGLRERSTQGMALTFATLPRFAAGTAISVSLEYRRALLDELIPSPAPPIVPLTPRGGVVDCDPPAPAMASQRPRRAPSATILAGSSRADTVPSSPSVDFEEEATRTFVPRGVQTS